MSMESQVANAAKLLDKNVPGWADKVKLTYLHMDSANLCVLGQVFGGAFGVDKKYHLKAFGTDSTGAYMDDPKQLKKLTNLWKAEIKNRRA